jgi:hypothetical protein
MNAESWKQRAKQLRSETYALYLAYKDPSIPFPFYKTIRVTVSCIASRG